MNFSQELLGPDLEIEALPLIIAHAAEVDHPEEAPLNVVWEKYYQMQHLNLVRIFTARNDGGELVGYSVFFVHKGTQRGDTLQANQDALYVKPEYRGTNGALIKFAEERLKLEGCEKLYITLRSNSSGRVLVNNGYEHTQSVYAKSLK